MLNPWEGSRGTAYHYKWWWGINMSSQTFCTLSSQRCFVPTPTFYNMFEIRRLIMSRMFDTFRCFCFRLLFRAPRRLPQTYFSWQCGEGLNTRLNVQRSQCGKILIVITDFILRDWRGELNSPTWLERSAAGKGGGVKGGCVPLPQLLRQCVPPLTVSSLTVCFSRSRPADCRPRARWCWTAGDSSASAGVSVFPARFPSLNTAQTRSPSGVLSSLQHGGRDIQSPGWGQARADLRWVCAGSGALARLGWRFDTFLLKLGKMKRL